MAKKSKIKRDATGAMYVRKFGGIAYHLTSGVYTKGDAKEYVEYLTQRNRKARSVKVKRGVYRVYVANIR